jgi:uncharacterized protein YdhG (YjbR/CyaY superfamily)
MSISPFETSRGTIRFPLDKPIPIALVKRIVKYRVRQKWEETRVK